MRYKNKIKSQKGAITLYVLISMIFLLIVISVIYFNTSNKIQKQEKEIEKIQKEYEQEDINDIYEETYNNYVNTETPTIQIYDGDNLKSEVIGEKVSSRKTTYLANENVRLKFLSKNTSDKYAYSTTENGKKNKIEGNTLDIDITTSGKTIYVYIEDNNGNYSKNYTAVTMILVTLQDKTIYVEEGKYTEIGEIQGKNAGKITFGQIEDSEIIKLDGEKITGLKAGTTTLIATEEKAGATATITVKVVKIELEAISGTMLVGESRTVKIIGINNGTLSGTTSDEEVSTVSISNNEIIITAKKEGNATITVTESNAKATATYEIKVASVALEPNGGTYTMPTEGNAIIKTTVIAVNAEKIETAWSDNAGKWNIIENNKLVEKTDCTAGTYYLYVRINGESIYKSKEFIVGENTLAENKITITPSTTSWTNGNITATVAYGSTLTANKKAGYGTTLANAQSAASTSTATSLTATANGYFYAEATDAAGNKITASLQVTKIDKTLPTVTLSPNGGTYTIPTGGTKATIKTKLTAADTGGSELKTLQYAWSTSNSTAPTSWTTFTNGDTVSKTDCTAQNYYLWTNVIDNAGNTATSVRTSSSFTVKANTDSTTKITITPSKTNWTNGNITATVAYGSTLTANKKAGYGTTLANAQSAASTSTATSLTATANGYFYAEATDAAGNKVTASFQVTKIDKKLPTVTLSPNGGTYTIPTGGTKATIKTKLTAADTGGSELKTLQYAWSTSNSTAPTSWTTFTNGDTVSKTDCTAQNYYLWTNVIDNAGNTATSVRTSNSFTVKANTDATSKITITPSTTAWTNGNITATVAYGSTLIANKKAGYGTTLANAQSAASTSTATSLTATANGYFYAEATDAAGNKVTASLQVTKIDKTLPTVTLSPNGGTYTIPTGGTKATIKTKLTAADTGGSGLKTLQYAWSTSNSTAPTSWTTFTNGDTVSKTDCTAQNYYLWTNVIDNAGNTATSVRTSSVFTVKANTDSTTKITIKPSTTNWTNQNITATVAYGSTLIANKKAGYGTTLANAQSAASTSTATSLTATANGYFYAEATDAAGNKVTASFQVTKIDKKLPTVTLSPNGGTYTIPTGGTKATIKTKITAADTGGSELKTLQYAWSTSNSTAPTSWTTFTNGDTVSKTDCTAQNYYLWTNVIDNAGNTATSVRTSNSFTVKANTDSTTKITITPSKTNWTNGNITATVTYGSTLTANKKAGYGTTLANAQSAASTSTATSLTATANGYFYAEATDAAGNKVTASLQVTKIDKTLPTVTLSPNGGTYTIPTGGTKATIKTKLTAADTGGSGLKTLQYAWSTSNSTAPTSWTTFTNGDTVSKTDCTAQNYYLWTNVIDNAGNTATSVRTSSSFTVKANTDSTTKITITPSKTNWTNGNITATVAYGSTLTANKKAGYGTTLANAQSAASTSTATSLTATANGYFYAEATDVAGNKVTASFQVTKIDKTAPTVGSVTGSTATGNTGTVTVSTIADTGGSGLKGIYISTSSTTPTATSVTWTTNTASSYTKTVSANGTYYVWVLDNAGNVSAVKSCTVSGIVPKVTGVTLTNAIVKKGSKVTIAKTLAGSTSYKTIAFTSGTTATATIVSGTGEAKGVAAGTSTITCTVTNYDGTTVSGTCTLTVVNLSYSPNGGSYAIPYTNNTAGTATIKSKVTISGATTSYYAWSTSKTTTPTSWSKYSAATGGTPSKTSTTAATYYLWNKVTDTSGNYVTYVSNNFTITANKITITPSTTAWTSGNVTCTIAYPSATTSSTRKAAYGSTLAASTTASSSATAPTTSVTVSANGYVYAQATDAAGNKVTASLQITNIDKVEPNTATLSAGTVSLTKSVVLTASGTDNESKIKEYAIYVNGSKVSSTNTYTITNMQFNVSYSCYAIVTDEAGNTKQSSTITTINQLYVSNVTDLRNLATAVNSGNTFSGKTITQTTNIDLGCSDSNQWTPIGNATNPFAGTYDGSNKKISNIYISNSQDKQALFGYNTGTIKNIALESGTIKANNFVAGIVGNNTGTISNSSNKAKIIATIVGNYEVDGNTAIFPVVGGITGYNSGKIEKCYNEGVVTVDIGTNTSGNSYSGGICGRNSGSINYCYNSGSISGKSSRDTVAGGIAGDNTGSGIVTNSYNKGEVSIVTSNTSRQPPSMWCGGIVGFNRSEATISNTYNIGTIKGGGYDGYYVGGISYNWEGVNGTVTNSYYLSTCGATGAGTSKTSTQLKGLASTLGSAFKADSSNINEGYPILSWQ